MKIKYKKVNSSQRETQIGDVVETSNNESYLVIKAFKDSGHRYCLLNLRDNRLYMGFSNLALVNLGKYLFTEVITNVVCNDAVAIELTV